MLDDHLLFARPVKTKLKIINQFELDPKRYIDRNYFMRLNQIETTDSRINIFEQDSVFEFFDEVDGPKWVGNKYVRTENHLDEFGN